MEALYRSKLHSDKIYRYMSGWRDRGNAAARVKVKAVIAALEATVNEARSSVKKKNI